MKWLPHNFVCLQKKKKNATHTVSNKVRIRLHGILWNKTTSVNHLVEYI